MLSLEHVAVRYSGRPVLRDVTFSIGPGEIVAYLGANGAGKTTMMKVVTGLAAPTWVLEDRPEATAARIAHVVSGATAGAP